MSVNRKSASSKPALEVKGDQSSSTFGVDDSGGVFGGTNTPFLSQRQAASRGENRGMLKALYIPFRFGW